MLKAMLRGLFAHKLRLLLSAAAVVLGTMFMTSAFVAGDTIGQGFTNLFTTISQDLDVQVTAPAPETGFETGVITNFVPESTAAQIAAVDGVAKATRQVASDGARLIDKNGKVIATAGPPRLGVAWVDDDPLVELREGAAPVGPDQVALSANLAKTSGYSVGDKVEVITLQERRPFTVAGILGYTGGRDSLGGETIIAFDMPTAQQLMLGQPDVYTSVDVKGAEGVAQPELANRVKAAVGAGFEVKTAEQVADDAASGTQTFVNILKIGLTVFAIIGLITGAFLIFNTFSMLVAQRTRELALYRSFGASRGQVNRSVLLEAVLLGLIATAVGILLGIGVGWLIKELLESFSGSSLPVNGVVVRPYVIISTLLVGVGFTVVAAVVPALRASRVAPIEAMRDAVTPDKSVRVISIIGGGLLAAGVALLVLRMTDVIEGNLALTLGGGALLTFLGVIMLAPLLSRPITRWIGSIFGWNVAGRLGARNTGRNPRRTAITAAALTLGVMLATAAGLFAASLKAGVTDAFTSDVKAELVVTPGLTGSPQAGFDPALENQMKAIPGVQTAAALRADFGSVNDGTSQLVAGDALAMASLFTLTAREGEIRPLSAGEIILDNGTAERTSAGVGDTVTVTTARGGEQARTVVAVLESTPVMSGPLLNLTDAQGFTSPLAQAGYIQLTEDGDVNAVKTQLDQLFADNPEVSVVDQAELLRQSTSFLDILLTIVNVLLALAIVVAVLGVINTLLLSVFERTREIGLIRAIGLSRGSTSWMVTVESILISVFGALLGIALGVGLGLAAVQILGGDFLKLTIPWGYLIATLVLAIVAGVLASIMPAITVARLNVLQAIAYE